MRIVKACAVVVTYNPDSAITARIAAIRREVDSVIVVDNGTTDEQLLSLATKRKRGVRLICLGKNTGIAHAQNVGLAEAFAAGADAVVLFDQDSTPSPGLVRVLWGTSEGVHITGPRTFDPNVGAYSRHPCFSGILFARKHAPEKGSMDVMMVIASGCLIPRSVFESVGEMRDELFIDYVDWEYCLRARQLGIRCLVAGQAVLTHTRGYRKMKKIGPLRFYPLGYASWRYEKIFQNRIMVMKKYGIQFPGFLFLEILSFIYEIFLVLIDERPWKNMRSVLRGIRRGCGNSIR